MALRPFFPLDPEQSLGGGVGAYARQPNRIVELQPKSAKLRSLLHSGRVGMFGVYIGHTGQAIIFVVYGRVVK